jgi:muconolactone D-isomerase
LVEGKAPGDESDRKGAQHAVRQGRRAEAHLPDCRLARNFSIWEAETLEELHETLTSLPLHPYMDIEIYPLIRHTTTEAWEAEFGAMPEF